MDAHGSLNTKKLWTVFYTFPDRWIGWNCWHTNIAEQSAESVEQAFLIWVRQGFDKAGGLHYVITQHAAEKSL